jgi:hypothetical protein
LTSCDGRKDADSEDLIDSTDTIKSTVLNIGGELFSIPSPIQTAMLVQRSGIEYDKSVLSPANKQNTYSTEFSMALILGIYGADLGYVSLYNQNQDALGYLASIKHLSDRLGVSAAFDQATMERIKNNLTNRDSMMVLVGLAYRASDAYLKDNKRNDISSLVLAGGWIESMHFSYSAYKNKKNDQLKLRIAEQKQALSSLVRILDANESEEARELSASLGEVSKVYEGVTFKYQFVEPTTDPEKRITYINSTTEVNVTDDQIREIGDKISTIRNKIVNITQS